MERTFYSSKCLDEGSLGAMIVSLEYVNSTKQYLHRYAIFFWNFQFAYFKNTSRWLDCSFCDLWRLTQSNFIEITLRHICYSVNLLHIFSTPFPKNTYGGLHLNARWFAASLDRPITVFFKKQDNMSKFLRKCLIYFHKKCLYKQML